jgi:hypothetical protein
MIINQISSSFLRRNIKQVVNEVIKELGLVLTKDIIQKRIV